MREQTTEEQEVDQLAAFAFDCWPEVSRLPLYRALEAHKGIGPRAMRYMLAQKGAVVAAAPVVEVPRVLGGR